MKYVLAAILFALLSTSDVVAQDHSCCSVVERALASAHRIKIGMERQDVERLFLRGGGVTFGDETTYVAKECHLLSIEVSFKQPNGKIARDRSDDVVSKVSEMRVLTPAMD